MRIAPLNLARGGALWQNAEIVRVPRFAFRHFEIHGLRRPGFHQAPALFPTRRVDGGSPGNRQIGFWVVEYLGRGFGIPSRELGAEALAQQGRGQRSAVAEQKIDGRLSVQKRGQMAGDCAVGGVGKPQFAQARASFAGPIRGRNLGEETFEKFGAQSGRIHRDAAGAGEKSSARGGQEEFGGNGDAGREQGFLQAAAFRQEKAQLTGCERGGVGFQGLSETFGEAAVEIVAAEEQVFADGAASDAGRGAGLDVEEGKVGGAAPDVDDEEGGGAVHGEGRGFFEPAVEGGLGFLHEVRVGGQTGEEGGFEGELQRGGVEGSGNGEGEGLLGEGQTVGGFPGLAEMSEEAGGGFDGGEAEVGGQIGGLPGKEAGFAVDGGVAEPGFGRVQDASGLGEGHVAGPEAGHPVAAVGWEIKAGGKGGGGAAAGGVGGLGNVEDPRHGVREVQIQRRQRTIAGAQIDSNSITWRDHGHHRAQRKTFSGKRRKRRRRFMQVS